MSLYSILSNPRKPVHAFNEIYTLNHEMSISYTTSVHK